MARAGGRRVERVSLRAGHLVATPGRSTGLAFAVPLAVDTLPMRRAVSHYLIDDTVLSNDERRSRLSGLVVRR